MNAPLSIDQLLSQYWTAKAHADQAASTLADIQAAIAALIPKKEEGSTTIEVADTKITATHKLNRKVDTEWLREHWDAVPKSAQRCFAWKADVSLKDLRSAQNMDPEAYAEACKFITTTPAKPALKIERK